MQRGRSDSVPEIASQKGDCLAQALGGDLDLLLGAQVAEPEMTLAARAEGAARRQADLGDVDQFHRGGIRICHAVDAEEQVEGAVGTREAAAAGGLDGLRDDVARLTAFVI